MIQHCHPDPLQLQIIPINSWLNVTVIHSLLLDGCREFFIIQNSASTGSVTELVIEFVIPPWSRQHSTHRL